MFVKLLTRAGLALVPIAAAGAAHAQQPAAQAPAASTAPKKMYVSLSAGSFSDSEYDYRVNGIPIDTTLEAGYGVEGALGFRIGKIFRAEVAAGFQDHNDARSTFGNGSGVSAITLGGNAYLDTSRGQMLNFYIGGGLGVAALTVDDGVIDDSSGVGVFAQGIVGIDLTLAQSTQLFIEARARGIGFSVEDTAGNASDITLGTTSVHGGLRFLF